MSLPSTVVFSAGDVAPTYITALNQLVTDMNAAYAAFIATTSAALFSGASATSTAIGTGSKSFTLSDGTARAWQVGASLRIASNANPANYMEGQVTAYSHPSLTVNVATTGGSGTLADWRIGVAASPAAITALSVGSATALQMIRINSAGNAVEGVTFSYPAIDNLLAQAQLGGF